MWCSMECQITSVKLTEIEECCTKDHYYTIHSLHHSYQVNTHNGQVEKTDSLVKQEFSVASI